MLSPQLSQDPRRKKGERSACNAGDPGSIPGSGRSSGEGIGLPTPVFLGFPCGSAGKEVTHNAGDLGWIPRLGWSPGEGKGFPLQYSGLENSMDCTVHGVTKSWTWLSNFHFQPQDSPMEPCGAWQTKLQRSGVGLLLMACRFPGKPGLSPSEVKSIATCEWRGDSDEGGAPWGPLCSGCAGGKAQLVWFCIFSWQDA